MFIIKRLVEKKIWLISHQCDTVAGPCRPAGIDVLENFIYFFYKWVQNHQGHDAGTWILFKMLGKTTNLMSLNLLT